MGMLKEFKNFALKGNIVDLAVAVIVGAAFGTIISSLVDDVLTPLLLTPALKAAQADNLDQLAWGAVRYGKFLSAVLKFVVIAFVLFLIIRSMNRYNKNVTAPAAPPEEIALLREIRDALKNK
jgi:large conductance mechanosensitive channel